jgi:hypothetical protein
VEIIEVVDSLDVAPETVREFYVKQADGKFKFDPAGATAGLKNNRDEILREKNTLETKFRGVDVEEYKRLKAVTPPVKKKEGTEDDDTVDARLTSLTTAHTAALSEKDQVIGKVTKSLQRNLIQNAAVTALTISKAKVAVMLPHVIGSLKMVETKDGDYVARVIDSSGEVRYLNGKEMTIEELVAEYKKNPDFATNFEADKGQGGGAAATTRKAGAEGATERPTNPVERLKAARRA